MIKFPGSKKGQGVTLKGFTIDLDILLTKKILIEISINKFPKQPSGKRAVKMCEKAERH